MSRPVLIGALLTLVAALGLTWTLWPDTGVRLAPSDPLGDAPFGFAVALDGQTALVSAFSGGVYVFVRKGGTWTEQAQLVPRGFEAEDGTYGDEAYLFGSAVALDGDLALVGASGASNDQGGVYVFAREGSRWTQQARLSPADALGFGSSVALSADTALVGAVRTNSFTGAAYVFVRDGARWVQRARLAPPDSVMYSSFGAAVALSDGRALIGAPSDDGQASRAGAAYVFAGRDSAWTEEARLEASGATRFAEFGSAVALEGETAVVGAQDSQSDDSGAVVYAFVRDNTTWVEQARLGGDGSHGPAVALDGETILVGGSEVLVFTRTGGTWAETARLARAGRDVALEDGTALVAAFGRNGAGYVYEGIGRAR